jgi:hypothetical protein
MRVLVLGGAGNFGARIVGALNDDPTIDLVAAGRRDSVVPGAECVQRALIDIDAWDLPAKIAALKPDLVVHCVGPFQGQNYRVPAAVLAAGAHYLDLADGRDYVANFAAANALAARAAGRVALSGVSTLPALSSAVVDHLRIGLTSIESIEVAIAPGQKAARGRATLAAVLSYLGRRVAVWREGKSTTAWGWMDLKRIGLDSGSRWGALCDVPDLSLLPERYPEVRSVSFHAALEFGLQQGVMWLLAGLRRMGVPLPVWRIATALNAIAGLFDPFAGRSGAMRVSVVGMSALGQRLRRTWQLTAPALNGPQIPCMAAILLARRLAGGEQMKAGAFACMGFLSLAEFESLFARWEITTRVEECAA